MWSNSQKSARNLILGPLSERRADHRMHYATVSGLNWSMTASRTLRLWQPPRGVLG